MENVTLIIRHTEHYTSVVAFKTDEDARRALKSGEYPHPEEYAIHHVKVNTYPREIN